MNFSVWPYSFYQYNSSSIGINLNSSSGYESASTDTSLIEPYLSSSLPPVRIEQLNVINDYHNGLIEDNHININQESTGDYDKNYHRKKRRILSRLQREEANRRERHRMEIINQAYEDLQNVLPFKKGRKRQKMSRMDTVDGAIQYIQSLLEILHGSNDNREFLQQ
ncbi:unnamed protein product [Rotaria sordida]|uniref:BHLH domain-containing protein n=1 Tax=Rotaria sordida TaxID=392033 RepID=A0A818LN24_9BILA|nr:unnamed protein product [Rotaria sordida]CAF0847472.1 unnamed protein product [Rotaria sordida]CAF0967133.1 unnamed protein product [Rotaria sordida]CAF3580985.1 unnamed protein product [Rotaria sordida]